MKSILLMLALAAAAAAQNRPAVDWAKAEPEIVDRFRELLRIDTSNPPGNERRAAEWLKRILDGEGIENEVIPFAPGRANLWARIPASRVVSGPRSEQPKRSRISGVVAALGNGSTVSGASDLSIKLPAASSALTRASSRPLWSSFSAADSMAVLPAARSIFFSIDGTAVGWPS